jgi:hypothetical protein
MPIWTTVKTHLQNNWKKYAIGTALSAALYSAYLFGKSSGHSERNEQIKAQQIAPPILFPDADSRDDCFVNEIVYLPNGHRLIYKISERGAADFYALAERRYPSSCSSRDRKVRERAVVRLLQELDADRDRVITLQDILAAQH